MPYGPETPAVTYPIPNPPVGPLAEAALVHNEAVLNDPANPGADPARAAGYQQQLDDPSTPYPGADSPYGGPTTSNPADIEAARSRNALTPAARGAARSRTASAPAAAASTPAAKG